MREGTEIELGLTKINEKQFARERPNLKETKRERHCRFGVSMFDVSLQWDAIAK